jgi:hypothetical protein
MKEFKLTYEVYWVNHFSAFVPFSLDPVPIDKSKKAIDIVHADVIAIPLRSIITHKSILS